jgi:hypothetical protein
MGIADRPQPGRTDVEELKREQELERRKQMIERHDEEEDVMMKEATRGI